jgi:hypothetical protein
MTQLKCPNCHHVIEVAVKDVTLSEDARWQRSLAALRRDRATQPLILRTVQPTTYQPPFIRPRGDQ